MALSERDITSYWTEVRSSVGRIRVAGIVSVRCSLAPSETLSVSEGQAQVMGRHPASKPNVTLVPLIIGDRLIYVNGKNRPALSC